MNQENQDENNTVPEGLTGDATENLTENLTGDVTEDVTGDVTENLTEGVQKVVPKYVENKCEEYKKSQKDYQRWHYRCLISSLVFSVLTTGTLLIEKEQIYGLDPKFLTAFSSLLTTLSTALSSGLKFRDKYITYKIYYEEIRGLKARYLEKDLDSKELVRKVNNIETKRLEEWKEVMSEDKESE